MKKKRGLVISNLHVSRKYTLTTNLPLPYSKKPTQELISLFEQASNHLANFAQVWIRIKEKGLKEGYTEKDLQNMLRPYLRSIGKTKDQIYYLFHRDEQLDRVKENRNFTTYDDNKEKEKLHIMISEKDNEINQLKSKVAELEKARELTPEERDQLSIVKDKIEKCEEEYVKFYKEIEEPWIRRKADFVLEWAKDLELKYKILNKPLGTILRDIIFRMKFLDVVKGGEKLIYDCVPDKYKVNYTKSQMLYDVYGLD